MKKLIKHITETLLLAGIIPLASACSDAFLDMQSPNQLSENTYWKTENDALMALTACYDGLQAKSLYNDDVNGDQFGILMRESSTDNGSHTWGAWMLGSTIEQNTSGTNDKCFQRYWNANYEVIKRCNTLLANIGRIGMDDTKTDGYKAEAIALRALMYCNLTSVFRDVPYLTAPLTITQAEAPKSPKTQIVANVLADLKEWVPKLPVKGTEKRGRMTREAGYAIMGRLALYNREWDTAINAYQQVIGKASLFKSDDGSDYYKNFRDLFTVANETCDEVLLSVHYFGPGQGEGSTIPVAWGAPLNAVEASFDLSCEFRKLDGTPFVPTEEQYNRDKISKATFEGRDPRLKATLMLPGMEWNGAPYGTETEAKADPTGKTKVIPAKSYCCILKWFIPEDTANEYDGSLDFYIIRYAEVLLSLAEAMIEKGGYQQSEITQHINEVRARVGMPAVENVPTEGSGLSQEQLREIVRHERRVELAFEDLRFADLYRWNDWEKATQRKQKDRAAGLSPGYNINDIRGVQESVWPIPQSEIDTNSQLKQHEEWL